MLSTAPVDSYSRVTIYLARDGVELGECESQDLEQLTREGQVVPSDHYWHEGMEQWLLVSDWLAKERPPTAPQSPRVLKPARSDKPLAVREPPRVRERTVRIPVEQPAAGPPAKQYRDPKEFIRQRRKLPREPRTLGPPNTHLRTIAIAIAVLLLLALALYLFFTARSDRAGRAGALFAPITFTPPPSADQLRDKAAQELKEKIERLPGQPTPPLQTFFYDVKVNMQKSLSTRVPWWAVIRGGENVVNPETGQTIVRTDFILTVEYRDGQWTFKHYRASASDLVKEETREIEEDEKTTVPPSIVGMLGVKMPGRD